MVAVLLLSGLLTACGAGPGSRRAPRHYAQSLDSATNSCRQNPELCTAVAGEEVVVPLPQTARVAATLGTAAVGGKYVIEADVQARIEKALAECADEARSYVLLMHMDGRSPTYEECTEVLFTEPGGQEVTRAMWLGEKMHQVALPCVEQKLNEFLSGRFSVEPRYRYNPSTGRPEWISPEEVKALLRQGRSQELKGTIAPDVVIHMGNPVLVQQVFDFKFPCVNTDERSSWRPYPRGHPYQGRSQRDVYGQILRAPVRSVQPRIGVEP
jgi:hypothetical protein